MQKNWKILSLLLLLGVSLMAQSPDKRSIRIVDTLTAQERQSRNPILLRSELDSLVQAHTVPVISQEPALDPKTEKSNGAESMWWLLGASACIIALLIVVVFQVYRHQQKINRLVAGEEFESSTETLPIPAKGKGLRTKTGAAALETRIRHLDAELLKLSKENEGMNRVIREYNGIQHEYDALKQGMRKAYKIRNYPGYDRDKKDHQALTAVLETENNVAAYAYEKFLKPLLTITDTNKNNPAKISEQEQERVLDLLVSLSLLYIEYLYLRVNELAIGGRMVERIQGLGKGATIDPELLKKLNTDSGNRALVLRMVLNKARIGKLSYPVFEETNLNHQ